ncbi:MAG: hypothetical protein Q8K99_09385 [Actinomycetota bacterium]|nr:hypothetical protein [Actinomycetota bacterium]
MTADGMTAILTQVLVEDDQSLVIKGRGGGGLLGAGAARNVQPGLALRVWYPGHTLTDPIFHRQPPNLP